MSHEVRIAIVEDAAVVRRDLKALLNARAGWCVVVECASAAEALEQIPPTQPEVILLDIGLNGKRSGVDLIPSLKAALPKASILMLTVSSDPATLARTIRLGAVGYLLKGDPVSLISNIEEVLGGGSPVMSPSVARQLWSMAQKDLAGVAASDHGLTQREWEVLRLAAKGLQQGEIALALDISVNTVKVFRRRIFEKLGVGSVIEALVRLRNRTGMLGD